VDGEPIKYELEKESGALFVDRFFYTPMRYPGNYGFVPHTLCGDGDPLDVLVANTRTVADLPEITRSQIEHFFQHYKDLEPGKWVKIVRWGDVAAAREIILQSMRRAAQNA
jgi:inorganic pyrophosphatase